MRELEKEKSFHIDTAWLRGGFPGSYLASDEQLAWDWRSNFITTYLERDIPLLGPRLPAEQLHRFWKMLAFGQGAQLNSARLAGSLGVSGHTIRHYLDVLSDVYMVRQLQPWSGNSRKRLVKSPKIFVRDSGLLHRLANIPDLEVLLSHPLCGDSWEGFVIENLLAHLPDRWQASYYRTSAQAEIDLVLEAPGGRTVAVEVKRAAAPRLSKGFRLGSEDVGASERYCVIPTTERFPIPGGAEAMGLQELTEILLD